MSHSAALATTSSIREGSALLTLVSSRAESTTLRAAPLAGRWMPLDLILDSDVTSWFKAQSGTVIDASSANATPANARIVSDVVRLTLVDFRDDDRIGRDDGDGHGRS